jgi:hypothetical protein
MSNVIVGDRVLSADALGNTLFSPVVYIPHGPNKESALFTHITTESGRDVKMTNNHILPAGICGSLLPLVYASQVAVDACINTIAGQDKVVSIETVRSEGLYTLVTTEEYIVVNGIIASPFGANHLFANMFYNIHRFIYFTSPVILSSSVLHRLNENLGIFMPYFGPLAITSK